MMPACWRTTDEFRLILLSEVALSQLIAECPVVSLNSPTRTPVA